MENIDRIENNTYPKTAWGYEAREKKTLVSQQETEI